MAPAGRIDHLCFKLWFPGVMCPGGIPESNINQLGHRWRIGFPGNPGWAGNPGFLGNPGNPRFPGNPSWKAWISGKSKIPGNYMISRKSRISGILSLSVFGCYIPSWLGNPCDLRLSLAGISGLIDKFFASQKASPLLGFPLVSFRSFPFSPTLLLPSPGFVTPAKPRGTRTPRDCKEWGWGWGGG